MSIMRTAAHYTDGRLFEWAMATALVLIGLQVGTWPSLLGEWSHAWPALILVGVLRIMALVANGRSYVYGPRVRAFGALAGALVWSQVMVALLFVVPRSGAPSLEISVLLVLTVGEIYSSYRAATDVRASRQAT